MKNDISLILLPGLDGTGDLFRPFLEFLPENIKPVIVSYPKDIPYGYDELKQVVMASLPEDSNFIILGESFSGPLALMAADDKPDALKGIILCATFVRNPFRLIPSWLSSLSVSPVYYLWPMTIKVRAWFSGGKYKDIFKMALNAVKSVNPEVIANRVKAILKVNVEKELKDCRVPILYLTSTKDHLIKEHNIKNIKKIKKDVQEIKIDTLHFVLQLEPEKSAKEIIKFIESTAKDKSITMEVRLP
ncbi:MAG TPA: alpha/beta hydrolase [Nitrospirae bacterium]|nr:alpha/beta hydrolase [Nitrospirota bacterium]